MDENLKSEVKEKRNRLNYLVYQINYFSDFRCQRKTLWILAIPLILFEIILFYAESEGLRNVVISLAIPLAIGVALIYFGNKTESYKLALEYESELFDICNYLNIHDELRSNERYILSYICTSNEKYNLKNKFDIDKAVGTFEK